MDKEKFATQCLEHFRRVSEQALQEQRLFLCRILKKNEQTELGKRYGFSQIRVLADYQKKVPVSEFSDYDQIIERQIQGEEGLLFPEAPVFYCISSGSTGIPKYIPLCREDVEKQHIYEDGAVCAIIRESMPELSWQEIFGTVFETGEFFCTYMENGIMNGVRSGAYFRYARESGLLDISGYSAPGEVLFPPVLEDMQYVKIRFALEQETLTGIHCVFPNRLAGILYFIEKHWDALLHDMECGTVSEEFMVKPEWKTYLQEKLLPNPERAKNLRKIQKTKLGNQMIRKIWPKLKYIRVIGGELFQPYMKKIKEYAGEIPIHCFAYASSESIFGIGPYVNQPDQYVLLADMCFFEFLPEKEADAVPMTFAEVETGKKYELLITTLSGLYRYRIGDVVEVTGFYGQAPIIRICYRKNQILNLADEKMDLSQFESAMEQFQEEGCFQAKGYCVDGCYEDGRPFYRLYLETEEELPQDAETRLDQCLMRKSHGYEGARKIRELSKARICMIPSGTFDAYEKWEKNRGRRMEQRKPLRTLMTEEQKNFFRNLNERMERE
ncbi:MAG: GH3 auxin-responsive promoter family protein [Firmicutes bacterium]|nr:GH3 auxin-responsive promoter family protein [Blautia sp.]MDD7371242.1 GH3 auxin-responsive promoter family protein [Bacillota bacterium]